MALDPKENHIEIKDEIQKERRSFLKKTAYAAPSIIVLGQLLRPTTVAGCVGSGCDDTDGVGGGVGGDGRGWGSL